MALNDGSGRRFSRPRLIAGAGALAGGLAGRKSGTAPERGGERAPDVDGAA